MAVILPFDRLIRTLSATSPLTEADRTALLALPFTMRAFDPGSYLVREGDPPTQCAVIVSGYAYRQKLTGHGARQIVSLHIPGDPVDFQNLFLDVADHSVQTLTRADIAVVPRNALRELAMASHAITHGILVHTLIEAASVREWMLSIGRRNARARLAHLLCEFAIRLDAQGLAGKDGYELPMAQEQIADALGLTSVHVNRTLRALEKDGLLTRRGRFVSFPQWEALRATADFSSRYLHLDQKYGRVGLQHGEMLRA